MATYSGQNSFEFNDFNELTNNIPPGLQIFLAQQLLTNAAWQMTRYENPRAEAALELMNQCKVLRTAMKDDAAARAKK